MKVSLLVVRLEVERNKLPRDFEYEAVNYLKATQDLEVTTNVHDLSLTLQSEPIVEPKNFKEIPDLHRGSRKHGQVTIETYFPTEVMAESVEKFDKETNKALTIQYFSGNPLIETTRGILHLFKDKLLTPLDADHARSEMICMIGVPAKYTCQDLQKFIALANDTICFIKIIRDSRPNQYMVLIKFKDQLSADSFYQEYEGKQYNMLESEFSHLVYVSKVEALSTSEGGYLPIKGLTELPTCPVCLERMDESVAGILTVLCNHSFHNECLIRWQDDCCPVCRFRQTPEQELDQTCFECDSKESLWICLVCGYVGCGRYQDQHAFQHYQQTAHTFSMDLSNQRVWDYAGDNYVHRLIQNKGDGKLVAVDGTEQENGEKMDSLTLEYTYLLTNQLESQRLFFEQKIDFMEKDAYEKITLMQEDLHRSQQDLNHVEKKLIDTEKEKKCLEKKYENVVTKATNLGKELRDEKEINKCLRTNQVDWQNKVLELEERLKGVEGERKREVEELQSEIGDLMKHFEVQTAILNAEGAIKEDIQGGQLFLEQTQTQTQKGGARSKHKHRKK